MRKMLLLCLACFVWLAGCAGLPGQEPLNVSLAGVESLPGEGLELRMAVKLRVQNPNDAAVAFNGVAVNVELRGIDFASGVSDAQGTVPRFGETVLTVPVTVSAYAMARQALSFAMGDRTAVSWVASGRLADGGFGTRFHTKGEFPLPAGLSQAPAAAASRN